MKAKLSALMIAVALGGTACTLVDSASINRESAQEYAEVIQKARSERKLDTASATAKRVQRVFNRMRPYADAANNTNIPFQWEMNVIRDDEINAWAMPGGKMVVYTGMVEQLNLTDDELAAVIGHEMTHALKEHGKKEANRNIGVELGAQIGSNILTQLTSVDGKLVDAGLGLVTDLGVNKPFSRSDEREADMGGLRLMAQAGYNPNAAVTVWQKMNAIEDNNNLAEKILSTHPTNNARIDLIRKELPNVMPLYEQARLKGK